MGQEVTLTLSFTEIFALLSVVGGGVFGLLKLLINTKLNEIAKAQSSLAEQVTDLKELLEVLDSAYHKVDKEIAVQIAKWERNS